MTHLGLRVVWVEGVELGGQVDELAPAAGYGGGGAGDEHGHKVAHCDVDVGVCLLEPVGWTIN